MFGGVLLRMGLGNDVGLHPAGGVLSFDPQPVFFVPVLNRQFGIAVKRWEHEAIIDARQRRLDQAPDIMRIRRQTAEHPFGTIKTWMGSTHFLTRTLKRVSSEMSLHVLAYNLKRVIAILGAGPLMAAIRA